MNTVITIRAFKSGLDIKRINLFKKIARENLSKIILLLLDEKEDVLSALLHKNLILELILLNDSEIKKINLEYREKNQATNVLTLQFFSKEELATILIKDVQLGSIFISMDTLKRESIDFKISEEEHFLRLLIHGFLHIIGYDHNEEEEAKEMYNKEEYLLSKLKLNIDSIVSNYWKDGVS